MKATIVIPVFNTEPYLTQSIESLVNQTRKDFEILIVDDGSSGDATQIVEPFRQNGLAIRSTRHSENLGVLSARMTGIDQATSEYVGFLDPDDSARPTFIECLLGEAERTGADIVGSRRHKGAAKTRFAIEGAEAILAAYAERRICNINVWTKFYRRDFIANVGKLRRLSKTERFSNSEDLLINVLCALAHPTYAQIPEILVDYNESRRDSLTNPTSSGAIRRTFQTSMRIFEIINDEASEFQESVENMIVGTAKFIYRKILVRSNEDDLAFVSRCLTESPVGGLVMSAMLEEAQSLRSDLASERRRNARLREKLASERDKAARTKELLAQAWDREQRLRPILGYLWRWCVSTVMRRT